jgi:hypothetical protein
MNRTLTALLACSALVVGLAACGSPTEAAKISSPSQTSAPAASTAAPTTDEPDAEATEEPAAEDETEVAIPTSFKVGETAKIGDWQVTVTKVYKPTSKQVKRWNQFNDKAKGQYVVANYTAKYVGTERTADVGSDLSWKFGGSNGQVYDQAFLVTSSDDTDAPTEARPGGKLKLDVAFDVPVKAINGGVVTVEGYDDNFDTVYADFSF